MKGQSRKKGRIKHHKPQRIEESLQPKHSIKHKKKTHQHKSHAIHSSPSSNPPKASSSSSSSSFLDKVRARLAGGHFRMINEKLYTCTGKEALDYFKEDPELFNMVPLDSSSVNVAVFCLSLMGTNYASYLQEAYRVLKPSGWLLIAEVKSRFDPNNGGADPNHFTRAVCEMGFTSELKDFSNKMFVLLHFKKKEKKNSKGREIEWPELKPCLYKRR
ncbi:S-adenosyl-L-methionine-dependent methyltransferases superfamily protein isoform 2 [Hibiscus syriacus]|uniref:Ribosomal RNA-processing protein 8 n=1 Tax=Hibiscus syriacus TaxID=106335 RepID=A0A6A3AP58_HIBSY|nr:S-adenosyl-L-methionine-dependent methyltransferases superfamily protein isoform 2 [Hibiscus syriacus]